MDKTKNVNIVPLHDLLNADTSSTDAVSYSIKSNLNLSSNPSLRDRYNSPEVISELTSPLVEQTGKVIHDILSPVSAKSSRTNSISNNDTPSNALSLSTSDPHHSKKLLHLCNNIGCSISSSVSPVSSSRKSEEEDNFDDDDDVLKLVCKWDDCNKIYKQPELLYHHLCQDHIGRKSQRNLQLNCRWENCQTKTEKRDHITSHLRVHIPLKPFCCSSCNKKFKRPQDLKKHLKIHLDSGITLKRKRGPKIGSKRVSKKTPELMQQPINPRDQSLPVVSDHNTPERTKLPGLQQFVTDDILKCEPVYTPQLGSKLYSLLPDQGFYTQMTPISLQQQQINCRSGSDTPSPSSIMDALSMQVTANAASFFSEISQDMSSNIPSYSHHAIPLQVPVQVSQPQLRQNLAKYPQLPPLKNTLNEVAPPNNNQAFVNANMAKANILPSISDIPMLSARYNNTEKNLVQTQPVHLTTNVTQLHPQFQMYNAYTQRVLPNNGLQVLPTGNNYIQTHGSTLNMVENRYSTMQRNTGSNVEEHENVFSDEESEDETVFENTLEYVNIIRDYLMCAMLEDDFEQTEDEEDEEDKVGLFETEEIKNDRMISKYPEVVI